MSHPYGAHDYTIHITNANQTHEFILSFVHFCYLDSKSLFCNLEFRLFCVCISFFLTIWSFHVPRHKCDLNFTKPTTYDLDFHQWRYGSRGKSFYFNSSLLFDSCVSRRRRICFFVSHQNQSYPILSAFRLMSCWATSSRIGSFRTTALFRFDRLLCLQIAEYPSPSSSIFNSSCRPFLPIIRIGFAYLSHIPTIRWGKISAFQPSIRS